MVPSVAQRIAQAHEGQLTTKGVGLSTLAKGDHVWYMTKDAPRIDMVPVVVVSRDDYTVQFENGHERQTMRESLMLDESIQQLNML